MILIIYIIFNTIHSKMTFFLKRVFSSSSTTIKPTKTIEDVIKKFVSKQTINTQFGIYSTFDSLHPSTKIMLHDELYTSFRTALFDYKPVSYRTLVQFGMVFPTIVSIGVCEAPFDSITMALFSGGLMLEYEIVAFFGSLESDIKNRQHFLQKFFNDQIVRCANLELINTETGATEQTTSPEIKDMR